MRNMFRSAMLQQVLLHNNCLLYLFCILIGFALNEEDIWLPAQLVHIAEDQRFAVIETPIDHSFLPLDMFVFDGIKVIMLK